MELKKLEEICKEAMRRTNQHIAIEIEVKSYTTGTTMTEIKVWLSEEKKFVYGFSSPEAVANYVEQLGKETKGELL